MAGQSRFPSFKGLVQGSMKKRSKSSRIGASIRPMTPKDNQLPPRFPCTFSSNFDGAGCLRFAFLWGMVDGKLFLYTTKSGTAVYCPLPSFVTAALETLPRAEEYFFWTGKSKTKSAVGDWQRSLRRLFILGDGPGRRCAVRSG